MNCAWRFLQSSLPDAADSIGLPRWHGGKEPTCQCRRHEMKVWFLGQEDPSPLVRNGTPPQYSCLENSMDRRVWKSTVHGLSKSQAWLSDWSHHSWYYKMPDSHVGFIPFVDSRLKLQKRRIALLNYYILSFYLKKGLQNCTDNCVCQRSLRLLLLLKLT